MFSHILAGANEVQQSKDLYDAVLGALGHEPGGFDDNCQQRPCRSTTPTA
jgi:catechol 2,3-dioxygenase-like lactoylglutathione lyase family enzyme